MSKSQVAELTLDQLHRMTSEDMLQAIAGAELPQAGRSFMQSLKTCQPQTLAEIVLSARRVCRRQGY